MVVPDHVTADAATPWASLSTATIVDLTVTLSEFLPASWPGSIPFTHRPWNWYAERDPASGRRYHCSGPFSSYFMILDEHTGTHLDGPTHFVPPPESGLPHAGPLGTSTGDQLDLSAMSGEATVVDVSFLADEGIPGRSPDITPAHLTAWEGENGEIRTPVVLLKTAWDRYYTDGADGYHFVTGPLQVGDAKGWPAPTAAAMEALHARGVRLCGTDGPSMGSTHDGASVHWVGLERGMLFVEMLCHLDRIPLRGSYFQFLPIKVAGSTGGPGRAIAYIPGAADSPAASTEPLRAKPASDE